MRAVVCHEWGGIDRLTLGELPEPEAGPGEVLIEVTAAGLNFADLLRKNPTFPSRPGWRSPAGSLGSVMGSADFPKVSG